jgi:hypothetical protein
MRLCLGASLRDTHSDATAEPTKVRLTRQCGSRQSKGTPAAAAAPRSAGVKKGARADAAQSRQGPTRMRYFGLARPTSTTVGVTRLAGPDFMIEIAAVAVVNQ